MLTATNNHSTPTRRSALGFSAAAIAAGFTVPALAGVVNPDAELIRTCHRFAEEELARQHRYIVASEDAADEQDTPPDWSTYSWIAETPATTPEGCHAKALAYSAWDTDAYDNRGADTSELLAGLLRDMMAPTRNPIVARCTAKYGPLPPQYTAEGIWIGYSAEEREEIEAASKARRDAREAELAAERAEAIRRSTIETMTWDELEGQLRVNREFRDTLDGLREKILARLATRAA